MVVLGVDAHKRNHTVVAVDNIGRKLGQRTTGTTTDDHLQLLVWAQQFGDERLWAVEDCRGMSRRLERDLLGAGEKVVRVPPKLMAHTRDSARTYGKSDPIDALAVARAALREPNLPTAQLDGPSREVRLLVDHRLPGLVARLSRDLLQRCREHNAQIAAVEKELTGLVELLAPALLEVCGCATATAAKIVGETADTRRFRSRHAYARHTGTAPLPVWSGNQPRHRLSRVGNRQLNAAFTASQ